MDLSTITDVKELKALAYDQLALKEQAEVNIRALSQRIAEIQQEDTAEEESDLDTKEEQD